MGNVVKGRGTVLLTMSRSQNSLPILSGEEIAAFKAGRACQGCTVCCVWLPIPAGYVSQSEKPEKLPCPWLKKSGCRIYSRRPSMCRQFACTWLKHHHWPDEWRPDRSGLLCLTEPIASSVSGSAVYELIPERLASPLGRDIIRAVTTLSDFVICITVDGHRYNQTSQRCEPASPQTIGEPHFVRLLRKPSRSCREVVGQVKSQQELSLSPRIRMDRSQS